MTTERLEELKQAVHNLIFNEAPLLDDIYGLLQVLNEVEVDE